MTIRYSITWKTKNTRYWLFNEISLKQIVKQLEFNEINNQK